MMAAACKAHSTTRSTPMRRIFADFNNLGLDDDDPNRFELGFKDEAPALQGVVPVDGERVTFREPGSLEAEGVLHVEMARGRHYWYGVVDRNTWRDLDADDDEL
jgi:hypothetical protein